MFRLALLGVIGLLLVPVAQAQDPNRPVVEFLVSRDWSADGELLKPEAELADFTLEARIGCTPHNVVLPGQVSFFVASTPAFSRVVLNPAKATYRNSAESCRDPAHRETVSTHALVDITRDAGAFQTFEAKIQILVTESDPAGAKFEYGPFEVSLNITPDYLPLTQVTPAAYFQKAGPNQGFRFPVDITNLGNGQTNVSFEVTPRKDVAPSELVAPQTVNLESRNQRGPNALYKTTVVVEGKPPVTKGYVNMILSFDLRSSTSSTDPRGTETDDSKVTLSVQVQGGNPIGGVQPGLGFLATLLVAVFAVLARRRRP